MDVAVVGVIAGIVQAFFFFTSLGVIIVGPRYLRPRERDKLHETLRLAYEKGQPVPPELVEALVRDAPEPRLPTPDGDFRRGLVLVFVGLGFAAAAYALYLGIRVFSD